MSRLFGIGDTEFLLIIIFAFLLFGPDKLPGMGRTIGRGIRQFREASDSVTKVVQSEVIDPMTKAATGAGDSVKSKVASNEDADIDQEDLSTRTTETFAQRKTRLAAEKEQRQAAAAAAAQDAQAAADDASASSAPVSTQEAQEAASAAEAAAALTGVETKGELDEAMGHTTVAPASSAPAPQETAPDPTSAAALYGLASKPAAAPASSGEEDGASA